MVRIGECGGSLKERSLKVKGVEGKEFEFWLMYVCGYIIRTVVKS